MEGMDTICVLVLETGRSHLLFPVEDGVQSTGAKFSPEGIETCYTKVNRDVRGSQPEIHIRELGGSNFICITLPSLLVF